MSTLNRFRKNQGPKILGAFELDWKAPKAVLTRVKMQLGQFLGVSNLIDMKFPMFMGFLLDEPCEIVYTVFMHFPFRVVILLENWQC